MEELKKAILEFAQTNKKTKFYFNDMENPLREGKGFRDASSEALVNIWLTIWTQLSAGGLYLDDFMIGDGDVIPTSLESPGAVGPALKMTALWGRIKAR